MEVDGYQTLSLMKSHCKISITKDQSLKVSCSSREVAPNIHYISLLGKLFSLSRDRIHLIIMILHGFLFMDRRLDCLTELSPTTKHDAAAITHRLSVAKGFHPRELPTIQTPSQASKHHF